METKLCFLLLSNLSSDKKAPRVEEVIATEGAGILNWSLEGLARLKERGRFEVPAVIESATQGWKEWAEEKAEREHKRGRSGLSSGPSRRIRGRRWRGWGRPPTAGAPRMLAPFYRLGLSEYLLSTSFGE